MAQRPTCQATARDTGKRCRRRANTGEDFCSHHTEEAAAKTAADKAELLERVTVAGSITAACDQLGHGRGTVYLWRAADPEFREALVEARSVAYERLEASAYDRALNGTTRLVSLRDGNESRIYKQVEYDNKLTQFMLTHNMPERYRARMDVGLGAVRDRDGDRQLVDLLRADPDAIDRIDHVIDEVVGELVEGDP